MAIETVRNILLAAPSVTALVGQRISPLLRTQAETVPCVVLTRAGLDPFNCLSEPPTLNLNRVQLSAWAVTYDGARALADACRTALEAAGIVMESETDAEGYAPDVNEYRVTQNFIVWT